MLFKVVVVEFSQLHSLKYMVLIYQLEWLVRLNHYFQLVLVHTLKDLRFLLEVDHYEGIAIFVFIFANIVDSLDLISSISLYQFCIGCLLFEDFA